MFKTFIKSIEGGYTKLDALHVPVNSQVAADVQNQGLYLPHKPVESAHDAIAVTVPFADAVK